MEGQYRVYWAFIIVFAVLTDIGLSVPNFPSRGDYKTPAPQGSLTHWNYWYYDSIGNGFYRVRAQSGSGHGPNQFDHGTVYSKDEMYRELVEAGVIKPETQLANSGAPFPPRGDFKTPAPQGSRSYWNFWHYDSIGNGYYRVRTLSGSGHGPNQFDHGTVYSMDQMFKKLVEAGALKTCSRALGD